MNTKNNERIKIAICGELRSGKDTVGGLLRRKLDAEMFAFSEGIWKVIEVLYPKEYAERHERKPRYLLQGIGQALRQVDPDIWVNSTLNEISKKPSKNVIVTDLRQPNEYEALKNDGFIIVRVVADLETRKQRAREAGDNFDESALNHETEQHSKHFDVDFEIDNNGTANDLVLQVDKLVNRLRRGSTS